MSRLLLSAVGHRLPIILSVGLGLHLGGSVHALFDALGLTERVVRAHLAMPRVMCLLVLRVWPLRSVERVIESLRLPVPLRWLLLSIPGGELRRGHGGWLLGLRIDVLEAIEGHDDHRMRGVGAKGEVAICSHTDASVSLRVSVSASGSDSARPILWGERTRKGGVVRESVGRCENVAVEDKRHHRSTGDDRVDTGWNTHALGRFFAVCLPR